MPGRELTDRDRAVLDFERGWPAHERGKQAAIRATFGFTPSRYYQLIGELLDHDEARAYDPLLIRRLRRRRQARLARVDVPGLSDQSRHGS